MGLKLYNTLKREMEEFKPLEEGKVKMYSCGQTIYDDLHIGNARAYVAWDTLRRYLQYKGYTVRHVQNITDVGHLTDDGDQGEDKVEKRAKELGLEPMELVEDQIQRYFEDTQALNIERQNIVPRATGHINEMIHYVEKIIENGYGYEVDGSIYFDVESFAEDYPYGDMAKKDLNELKSEAEARVEHDEKKKNQFDFALWINADESHAMKWESPWSTGYPGWHLECSVMSQKYLGDEFDIHTGGKDHIFPHHPNERAQAFAATGHGQARYWLHNEFVKWQGEQMSKSTGNFVTVRDLLEEFEGDTIRLYINSAHYRSETNFSKEGLEKAEKELKKLRKAYKLSDGEGLEKEAEKAREKFEEFMDNDLNTAKAKQALVSLAGKVNSRGNASEDVGNTLQELSMVLGVDVRPDVTVRESSMADLLSELRDDSREREDYKTSDFIRERLENLGFEVEDSENGSQWFK